MSNERNTKQKGLILCAVKDSCRHPTAEEIYDTIVPQIPNISLTTVYRNLNKLAECGTIKRIYIPNEPDRFEHNTERHYHIRCESCGSFEDLDCLCYNFEFDGKCTPKGYYITDHDIIFKGVCPKCREHEI